MPKGVKGSTPVSACHPEKPSKAYGLCGACYAQVLRDNWTSEKRREVCRKKMKAHRHNRRNKRYREKQRDKSRLQRFKRYGITSEQFEDMKKNQAYLCAICGCLLDAKSRPSIDHDHKTGKVRSILCNRCNTGIALLREDIEILRKAIDYLEKHKEQTVKPRVSEIC